MKRETVEERIARMKEAKEAAKADSKDTSNDLIGQLTHEESGEPDFTEVAKKLQEIKEQEAKGENDGHVKLTIYIRKDIADSFNALITKRGQQKEFANQAFADFVVKKAREMGI